MEPTSETLAAIGQLCASWSALEAATEATIWGILDLDERIGPLLTWKQDLRGRWQIIIDNAYKKHSKDDIKILKHMNTKLVDVTRDRNIIVHGLIHSVVRLKDGLDPKKNLTTDDVVFDYHRLGLYFEVQKRVKVFWCPRNQ